MEPNRHPFFSYKNMTDKEESSGPNQRINSRRAQAYKHWTLETLLSDMVELARGGNGFEVVPGEVDLLPREHSYFSSKEKED
ncbi:hypothetical protein D5086_020836 [Populus alba]|uniref:Uncharacterized protein n=1 Tax=Populus alba TaxID=43335 RepID=A0ACC4BLT6_POPAL